MGRRPIVSAHTGWVTLVGACLFGILAIPSVALAGGYNDSGFSYGYPYGSSNTGWYVRDAEGGSQIESRQGPHGGYTTTTNKCKDCHAVHKAAGEGFMLMRGRFRHGACDYCHTGGGGSKINIQMDNDYDDGSTVPTSTRGYGTGHTIGYSGNAPVDIRPAYNDAGGLACFDCHTPHAATTRVLTTFANPGRAVEPSDEVVQPFGTGGVDLTAAYDAAYGVPGDGLYDLSVAADLAIGTTWGLTPKEGNIVVNYAGDGSGAERLPVWPTGRFLLLKNPDIEMVAGVEVTDTVVSDAADAAQNKLAIDWESPLGLADSSYSGGQDDRSTTGLPWNPGGAPGQLSVSEFCTDCHDGAAGSSSQSAVVWVPDESTNDALGAYETVSGHDSQPRLCFGQMYVSPAGSPGNPGDPSVGTDDNYGPTCRKCHMGASSCGQCHGVDDMGAAMDVYGINVLTNGETQYIPSANAHTTAVSGLSGQCVDGGFSYPHRTLGANMLKDELYGVDYDGTPVAAGELRDSGLALDLQNWAWEWHESAVSENDTASAIGSGRWLESGTQLSTSVPIAAENLDSVCIDCHGDATYWNGDDPAMLDPARGWELLYKGLP